MNEAIMMVVMMGSAVPLSSDENPNKRDLLREDQVEYYDEDNDLPSSFEQPPLWRQRPPSSID